MKYTKIVLTKRELAVLLEALTVSSIQLQDEYRVRTYRSAIRQLDAARSRGGADADTVTREDLARLRV